MKSFLDKYLFQILLGLIMFTAALLRLWDFASWSLTNDELSALNRLQFDNLSDVIRQGVMLSDFHPAGVQVFLYFWVKLVGPAAWLLRLPFVLCGIASVYVLFLIGRQWFGRNAALIAASIFSVLIYPVLMSQLARPYSPGLLFVLLSVYYWNRILFTENCKRFDYVLYALFLVLTAYMHNYSFLFVVILGFVGFFLVNKQNWKKYFASHVLASVLYLPHLNIFLYQFGIGGIGGEKGWLGAPDMYWLGDFLFYAFNNSGWFIALMLAVLLVILLGNQHGFRMQRAMWLSLVFFLVPYLIAHVYSLFRNPILQFSTLYFSFPFLLLLLVSFWKRESLIVTGFIVVIICIAGSISVLSGIQSYRDYQFADFKSVVHDMIKIETENPGTRTAWVLAANHPNYVRYYYDDANKISPEFPVYSLENGSEVKALVWMLDTTTAGMFGYARLKNALPGIPDIIEGTFPYLIFSEKYAGKSELYIFSKDSTLEKKPERKRISHFYTSFESEDDRFHVNRLMLDTNAFTGQYCYRIPAADEWGPGITIKTGELGLRFPSILRVTLNARSEAQLKDSPVVISITNSIGETYVWASSNLENFLKPGKWGRVVLTVQIPHPTSIDDVLKIFVWNKDHQEIFIDNMEITFYKDSESAL
ncbi:MAG: glycosyltransferase family 39 protein [Bacteroidales bacterium]|nr:glycosyltransferase family 39 protein [Bacteroidales bacterium]